MGKTRRVSFLVKEVAKLGINRYFLIHVQPRSCRFEQPHSSRQRPTKHFLPWLNFWVVRAGISRLLFILVVNFFAFVPESRRNNGDEKI